MNTMKSNSGFNNSGPSSFNFKMIYESHVNVVNSQTAWYLPCFLGTYVVLKVLR